MRVPGARDGGLLAQQQTVRFQGDLRVARRIAQQDDAAKGADAVDCIFQRGAEAAALNGDVGQMPAEGRANLVQEVRDCGIDGVKAALMCKFNLLIDHVHEQHVCARQPCPAARHDADGAGAEDHNVRAGKHLTLAHGVLRDAGRLDHGQLFKMDFRIVRFDKMPRAGDKAVFRKAAVAA